MPKARRAIRAPTALAVASCLALAGVGAAEAASQALGGARYFAGSHPTADTFLLRAPAIAGRLALTISYERTYPPLKRGSLTGSCLLVGQDGFDRRIDLPRLKVRTRQAADLVVRSGPVAAGDLLECSVRMRRMPRIPDGEWAEVQIGLREEGAPVVNPYVRITSIEPAADSRLTERDPVTIGVLVSNPTARSLQLNASLLEEGTGLSPGRVTFDEPVEIRPGEIGRLVTLSFQASPGTQCRWTTDRVAVGLFDPATGRLYAVYDGLELATIRLHGFRLRIC